MVRLEGNACVGGERQSGLRLADWGIRVSVRVLVFQSGAKTS